VSHFNYGGRIGMSTLIRLVIRLCDIYVKYSPKMKAYINDSTTLTSTQKSTVIAWLDGIVVSCEILRLLEVTYESK